jgi:2'-5' RNA ligase
VSPRNIGVAIGLPEPVAAELQGWREKLGDPSAARIVPHVTLLPPTAVASELLPQVEEHLRSVVENSRPFDVRLRGTATFRPVTPVVFVPLVEGIAECELLAERVRSGPLERELAYPYHPHVTVAQDVPDDALDRGYAALAEYEARFRVWGLQMFEQGADHVWRPQRDFPFRHATPGPQLRPGASW